MHHAWMVLSPTNVDYTVENGLGDGLGSSARSPPPPHPEGWIPVHLQATTDKSSLSTLLDFIIKKSQKYIPFFYIFIFIFTFTFLSFPC